jgi:ADP-L-glycero-D-manno-heptose 6-epimerase
MKKKTIIVTGGVGFLGSNLIKKLNERGRSNIVIIDNYDEKKFQNIRLLSFIDYISYEKGLEYVKSELNKYDIQAIIHVGANADVLERNPNIMLEANYEHSKFYLDFAVNKKMPFIYASSSAVYGDSKQSLVDNRFEQPHNIYAWSKWIFDKYVQANMFSFNNRVIGLRLFNIFGLGEFHKERNASLPYRFFSFINEKGFIDVFDKEIERDYVWVEDVADVIIDILNDRTIGNGIYNLGSGSPIKHLELAYIVAEEFIKTGVKKQNESLVKSVPMPKELVNSFQYYTKAENLIEIVSNRTGDNKSKIRKYINQLINLTYGNN